MIVSVLQPVLALVLVLARRFGTISKMIGKTRVVKVPVPYHL